MIENLVIVESPAKAKTIEKFLGNGYTVKSSFGHIRDLEKKDLGVDIEHNFQPKYEISSDKKTIVKELKTLAKEAKTVWLASDEDREGEAIAWHLFEVLKLKPENTKRIVFHEITKDAILHAIQNPRNIDKNLVDAQQARRVLGNIIPKLENHSYSEAGLPRASPYRCDASGISFLVVSGSWLVVRRGRHVGDPSGIGQHYPQAGKSLIF